MGYAQSYLNWVRETLLSVRGTFPNRSALASLLASAENAYRYSLDANASAMHPWSPEELEIAPALRDEARYLAILLGSRLFDYESGGEYTFDGVALDGSLFDAGLGWLPLGVLMGCDLNVSLQSANNHGAFSSVIPDIEYTLVLGSGCANVLSLDDIKLVAIRQVEDNAKCSERDLIDYLDKVSVSSWDYAIASSGDALLIAGGY